MANGRRHGNRDNQFGPERREARAIDLDPSAGGLHQGAQPPCCNSDAVHMAATDQMPDPNKALAPREPPTHGPSDIANASTRNEAGARDPEMLSTKKGDTWYFGSEADQKRRQWRVFPLNAHMGVDADSGIVHSLETTTARVHDSQVWDELLHGEETSVWADKGYVSAGGRPRSPVPASSGESCARRRRAALSTPSTPT